MVRPRPRVLLIHDDALMCDFVVDCLEPQGYAVETSSPASSLTRLEVGDIDLVLLDLGWPESNGLDLCMRMRSLPTAAHIPILALTECAKQARDVLAFGLLPEEYLSKPFAPEALVAVVARHCV